MPSAQQMSLTPSFGAEDFPARIYRLQTKESAEVLREQGADYFTNSQASSRSQDLDGYLWKMFPDYLIVKKERISEASSPRWMNSGMAFRGACWTQNFSERPRDGEGSILSEVIEPSAPLKYFLNSSQLRSLLLRDDARNIHMPKDLRRAIELQLATLSNMPELDAFLHLDPKGKDSATTEKLSHWIQEAAPTLFVRRMLPSEYEKLQGFPKGWTAIAGAPAATPSA